MLAISPHQRNHLAERAYWFCPRAQQRRTGELPEARLVGPTIEKFL